MKIIVGKVGSGKTKELIGYALQENLPILTLTKQKEASLIEKSLAYYDKIVTVLDLESAKEYKGDILVDDIDKAFNIMLSQITGNNNIKLSGAVLSAEDNNN